MILNRDNLKKIPAAPGWIIPDSSLFELPEKVLQFGTGVLLRGLPDYFIDKANREGIFKGRIVVVKSTGKGDSSSFDRQDNLYTLCIRGIEKEKQVEENIVCSAISRVLTATGHWEEILHCAHNPELRVIISNTTEAGIQWVDEDIHLSPTDSFPGKLLSFLYERYQAFNEAADSGMVIIPTELIPGNGEILKAIVIKLAQANKLEAAFLDWLRENNHFCNSLVDRIVPGRPDGAAAAALEAQGGYSDELITVAEPYRLWAIEGDETVASLLTFRQADEGVVIVRDIGLYRELKLRLLNGTHTLSSGIAVLAGIETVKEAMANKPLADYIGRLMEDEIAPAIPYPVEKSKAETFARSVLDRFRNGHIRHLWISITQQYSMKMKMRVVPVLLRYYQLFNKPPEKIAFGFAAYLLFEKSVKTEDGQAAYFQELWQQKDGAELVSEVLKNKELWDADLTALPGFEAAVARNLESISKRGILAMLSGK